MNKNDLNNISAKGPMATMNTIKADQRPLVAHFYGPSNSVGPAWVTEDTGCLHCSVFIIYPPSSLLYHFDFYRIIDFWSPAAPLCVLLSDEIFIHPKLTLPTDAEMRGESHCAFGSFLSATGSATGQFSTLTLFATLDPHGGNSRGVELEVRGGTTYMYRMHAHLVIKYSRFLEPRVKETTPLRILTWKEKKKKGTIFSCIISEGEEGPCCCCPVESILSPQFLDFLFSAKPHGIHSQDKPAIICALRFTFILTLLAQINLTQPTVKSRPLCEVKNI